ncbi:complex I subunit 4 family protein [Anianabacter salinae]|uniref:complex I subunit 4 family protein n=1 Tax=Anianabacter salinae TaxID=2851023 RepID=UPI00225E12AD|nr:NADH-quinone oxidoreductase subunit M [Anianabacter salinae]MBV0912759.1 NADH-quinone oxidoreductase subunit M [Anianabacter salinae]
MNMSTLTAVEQAGFPLLSLLLLVPAIATLLLWFGGSPVGARKFAIAAALTQLFLAVVVMIAFRTDHAGLQLAETVGFYRLGIDGLSILFLPLTAILTLFCLLATRPRHWEGIQSDVCELAQNSARTGPEVSKLTRSTLRETRYFAALMALSTILTGAFVVADMRLFWLCLSAEAFPAWYLLRYFGRVTETGSGNGGSARSFAVTMVLAAGLSLVGLELLAGYLGGSHYGLMATSPVPASVQGGAFVLLSLAFAIRAPLFPLHAWLPQVLNAGPAMGLGVFLVGLKIGTYGFLRFVIAPLPDATAEYGWIIAVLGAIGAVYGGLMALIQTDLRRLLGYASIAHMGVIVIGLFSFNVYGIEGGLLQMLTIGMAVAGLYVFGSFIAERVASPDVRHLGDLLSSAPWLAGVFLLTAMAAVGMPGTSGFNGEHLVVIGAVKTHWSLALAVAASTVLTAAYLLRFFMRAFMEPARPGQDGSGFSDLRGGERLIAGSLAAVVLLVGLNTGPFIALARPTVEAISARQPIREHSAVTQVLPSAFHQSHNTTDAN